MEVGSSSLPGTTHRRRQCVPGIKCLGLHPTRKRKVGGLAQLARAPALQAGGQRFESVILHNPLIEEEFFDILTHKTVSKDFKKSN